TLRGQPFKSESGFTDSNLNVDTVVSLATFLIHIENVAAS
ncbi:hypothetical protein F442_03108, partial [Phytophthora nicotianae P10297]